MIARIEAYGSSGRPVRADGYTSEAARQAGWVVVACPGYGSVKELMSPWGVELASRGYPTYVPAYQGYGDSPGEVGRIFPNEHVDDVQAVVRWVRANEATRNQKIAVIGVSYGGAIAIEASARTAEVDAVISIVGYGSGERHLRTARRYHEWLDLLDRIERDRLQRAISGESEPLTLDEILLRDEDAQAWRQRVEEEHPGMRFSVRVETADRLLSFAPENQLPFARDLPLLVIHAERDHMIPLDEAHILFNRAREPKRLLVIPDADHHDVHHGRAFRACIDGICDFLEKADNGGDP